MKNETILCYNCDSNIDFEEPDDFFEYGEENTCGLVECPSCGKQNRIYYTPCVYWDGGEPDEEDLKNFGE